MDDYFDWYGTHFNCRGRVVGVGFVLNTSLAVAVYQVWVERS